MTLFIKDSLPGKNTKAWQPLLSLLVLLILFRWYHQPLSPWVGTGKVGSLFLGLDNQPRVDSQRGSPVSYCVQETSLSFCPWGRCLTFCQSPLPTQCTKLNCLPPPPRSLPHQAARHSQSGSSSSGKRLRVTCFRFIRPLWVWSVSHSRHFSTGMDWLRAGLVGAIPWGQASMPSHTSLPTLYSRCLCKAAKA